MHVPADVALQPRLITFSLGAPLSSSPQLRPPGAASASLADGRSRSTWFGGRFESAAGISLIIAFLRAYPLAKQVRGPQWAVSRHTWLDSEGCAPRDGGTTGG